MTRDFLEFFGIVLGAICAVVSALFLIACLWAAGPERWACNALHEQTGLTTSYSFWNECFVQMPDGSMQPWSEVRKVISQKYELRMK